ncbi:MAG: M48 family metalloprotease [Bacteroidales bacterium]|nr:M48 family metalloprotease [Bacteroidales bacterium]
MKRFAGFLWILVMVSPIFLSSCNDDNDGINIFTVEDDKQLGLQMEQQIQSSPAEFPLLQPGQYPDAYQHIQQVRDRILQTGLVDFDTEFNWDVHIINDDSVLNAFCTPGGYIYFYTGLIKYLDNDAEFAGVMGHEMAHAAKRHSTEQMTKAYGLQVLLSVVLGENPNVLAQMAAELAAGVASLAFSRDDEYESDEYSVKYLYETTYDARGVAGFFEKIGGAGQPPEFLSTHPSPDNRVEKIYEIWQSLGGKEGETYPEEYQAFKNSLP